MRISLIGKESNNEAQFQTCGNGMKLCDLLKEYRNFVPSNQLLKSISSIGANIMEAQSAESKADFIHKMKVASKKTTESEYWLILCDYAGTYPECETL